MIPTPEPRQDVLSPRAAAWLVYGLWALMTAAALVFIALYVLNVPFFEDWHILPLLTGRQPADAAWFWSQTNEHRIPLPRLIALLILIPTRYDLRALCYVNVLALSAGVLLLIRGAARARGRTVLTDALFPLALLHLGNAENLYWSFQIQFISSIALSCALLGLIVRPGPPSSWSALASSLCIVGLILCGANGLVYAPPLVLWLLLCRAHYGAALSRPARLLLPLGAITALALTGLYFVGYAAPNWGVHPTPLRWGIGVVQFVSNEFGVFPRVWLVFGLAGLALLAATARLLLVTYRDRRQERPRAAGLFLFLAASAALAICTAWGRAATVGCLLARYVTLTAPMLCCVYLAWDLYGRPRIRTRLAWGLVLALALLLPWNTQDGLRSAGDRYRIASQFLADLRAGVPTDELAARYSPGLHYRDSDLRYYVRLLREAHLGACADDPPTANDSPR